MMKIVKNINLGLVILAFSANLSAQSFDDLATLNAKGYFPVTIKYKKEITTVINKKVDNEAEIDILRALRTKISSESPEEYIIEFNDGASADPHFNIYRLINSKEQKILTVNGLDLVIPGDGNIYVSGHTNNMFNMRRKFVVTNGKIEEVKQQYYYVGLKTETTREIELSPDLDFKESNIKLEKGQKIEVLINKGDDYLIRTENGVTGWFRFTFKNSYIHNTPIKGIYFRGD